MWKKFLIVWYYFWGDLISRLMYWLDLGFAYPLYNKWMCKSADMDINNWWWEIDETIF